MVKDFRKTDWGEPHTATNVTSAQNIPEQPESDFRVDKWGTPENATVVTPQAAVQRPEEDANKEDWEAYAQSQNLDTSGMTKKQIVDMVRENENA